MLLYWKYQNIEYLKKDKKLNDKRKVSKRAELLR